MGTKGRVNGKCYENILVQERWLQEANNKLTAKEEEAAPAQAKGGKVKGKVKHRAAVLKQAKLGRALMARAKMFAAKTSKFTNRGPEAAVKRFSRMLWKRQGPRLRR